jgi:uncharacterized protein (TIGR00369 family)
MKRHLDPDGVFTSALAEALDFDLDQASDSQVSGTWSVAESLHQPFGILHGGVHCLVAEGLASWGATAWYGEGGKVVGVSNTTDFFRAVSGGRMRTVARAVHQGRTSQVWTVDTTDPDGRTVAQSRVRLHHLDAVGGRRTQVASPDATAGQGAKRSART